MITPLTSVDMDLEGDDFLIIGGYESGIDAAYHLSKNDKKVRVFDMNCPWSEESSDPSIALSTYSFERMRDEKFGENVELLAETVVNSIVHQDGIYNLTTEDGQVFSQKENQFWQTDSMEVTNLSSTYLSKGMMVFHRLMIRTNLQLYLDVSLRTISSSRWPHFLFYFQV